jgi:hypothetical protein
MEWRSRLADRVVWRAQLPAMSFALRSGLARRAFRKWVERSAGADPDAYVPWLLGEASRGTIADIVDAGRALSRYDAREIVPVLAVPGQVIVTTRDRLVQPWRQYALAAALDAEPLELDADHDASFTAGTELAELVVEAIERLAQRPGRPAVA